MVQLSAVLAQASTDLVTRYSCLVDRAHYGTVVAAQGALALLRVSAAVCNTYIA
jgi:hypothetical protein